MSSFPPCPKCGSKLTYDDGSQYVWPECAHEWAKVATAESAGQKRVIRDANELNDGDTVMVIKDLKVEGASLVVKAKVRIKEAGFTSIC